MKDRRSN